MNEPPIPLDETARLKSLHFLKVLDTAPEERFDRITRIARRLFNVEICLISLVDSDRQWFKSKQGLDACETGRDISFCGHAILDDETFVIVDTLKDPRFADNPLVTGPPNIRFYAGCPVRSPSNFRVGTLCLIDSEPRELSGDEMEILRDMADMVENELALIAQSTVDELTQVANRRGFNSAMRQCLSVCSRAGLPAEIAFFDLDGFKEVNDSLGHEAGDNMLKHFAKLLRRCFRSADIVARLGGDEFAVFLAGSTEGCDVAFGRLEQLAADAADSIEGTLAWSVGRVQVDYDRHTTVESLLAEADTKMYEHKVSRRVSRR